MRLFKNGQYRWQLIQYNPLKDEHGQIVRWYATATDIDDQKKTEERLHNENIVLREEIDRSSMFGEIIGSSNPIRQLLKQVEKVAPSDSTVLVLGETGTGKELVARALHRKSKRASRAFACSGASHKCLLRDSDSVRQWPHAAHRFLAGGALLRPVRSARSQEERL